MYLRKRSNFKLSSFSLLILVSMIFFMASCKYDPAHTDLVVSDGITDNDLGHNRKEILPNVTVYKVLDKDSSFFAKFLLAENAEGLGVVFCVRPYGYTDWVRLGDKVFYTDKKGRVILPGIRKYLPKWILDMAPLDLQLQARVYFNNKTYISDDSGMIRVLSSNKSENKKVIFTDHDNTLHATGGLNSVQDWVDFLNEVKNDWPFVDDYVKDEVSKLRAEDKDLIIISGMPNDIRFKCREQMNLHFESGGKRFIPIIVKEDLGIDKGSEFKKETISILKDLYGERNCLAMVGDTVREDGFGAISNNIQYVPFQVHYKLIPSLLDTGGFGSVDPKDIAWDWKEVVNKIETGYLPEKNFFLKRYRKSLNIAHRGGGDLLPENTVQAYRNAYEAGADSIEGDVHMTKDGYLVISHDDTVDRCTNGSGKISDFTLEEIKNLDAGYNFTRDDGQTYPYRGKGFKIPTLEEVFSDPVLNRRPMVLEIKDEGRDIVVKTLDVIKKYNMEDNLILGGFDQGTVDMIKEISQDKGMDIVRIFATKGVVAFTFTPRCIMDDPSYERQGDVLCLPKEMMTTLIMDKARYLGLKVYVWTVNSEKEMKRELDSIKVDGVMSDNPELLATVMNN